MKKKIDKKSLILVLAIIVCLLLIFVWLWWSNDAYQPTIEEALNAHLETEIAPPRVKENICTFEYGNSAYMLYLSEENSLCSVDFEYDAQREKWKVSASGDLGYIPELETRWREIYGENDCPNEMVGETVLVGVRFHDGKIPFVNGQQTTVYTYEVICEDKVYSLDYWELKGFDGNLFNQKQLSFE